MSLEDDIAARDLTALAERLEALKVEFDRYFLGLEKRPPLQKRDQLARDMRRFKPGQDAVVRFKWQNLVQRRMTYNRMWERIMKAIEDGTYERDVKRADWRDRQKKKEVAEVSGDRARKASAKAKSVGDEADAFLESLGAVPMRGRPVGEPAAGERRPSSPSIPLPMRGRPVGDSSPPPTPAARTPSSAPVPRAPTPAPIPLRGAPKGPLPPLPPMRGRPVGDGDG